MKVFTSFLLLVLFCLFSVQGVAQETGMDLLHGCQAIIKDDQSTEDGIQAIYWSGFIQGYTDGYVLATAFGKQWCFPDEGIEVEQIARVTLKVLEGIPEKLHESARLLLVAALKTSFPCPEETP